MSLFLLNWVANNVVVAHMTNFIFCRQTNRQDKTTNRKDPWNLRNGKKHTHTHTNARTFVVEMNCYRTFLSKMNEIHKVSLTYSIKIEMKQVEEKVLNERGGVGGDAADILGSRTGCWIRISKSSCLIVRRRIPWSRLLIPAIDFAEWVINCK